MQALPPEVIVYMFHHLFEELGRFSPKDPDVMAGQVMIPFFHVPLVSKQFKDLYDQCMRSHELQRKQLGLEWTDLLEKMQCYPFSWSPLNEEPPTMKEPVLKMLRTQIYCDHSVDLLHKQVKLFRKEHNLSYYSKSKRLYTGELGIRKLKKIKVSVKAIATPWNALLSRYEKISKRAIVLRKKLEPHKMEIRRKQTLEWARKNLFVYVLAMGQVNVV